MKGLENSIKITPSCNNLLQEGVIFIYFEHILKKIKLKHRIGIFIQIYPYNKIVRKIRR